MVLTIQESQQPPHKLQTMCTQALIGEQASHDTEVMNFNDRAQRVKEIQIYIYIIPIIMEKMVWYTIILYTNLSGSK